MTLSSPDRGVRGFRRLVLMGAAASVVLGGVGGGFASAQAPAPPPQVEGAQPGRVTISLTAEQRAILARALAEADQHGFAPGEFAPAEMADLLKSRSPDDLARGQDMLVAGIVAYARAQHGGRSFQGGDWPKEWATRPGAYPAEQDFAFAVKQDKLADWLASLPPPFERYRVLKTALANVRAQAAKPPAPAAPAPRHAKKGASKAPAAPTGDGAPAVTAAVTLSPADQERTLIANMERWRWLPRNIPVDRIEVNSAAGLLQVVQNSQPTLAMKAVAGRPGDETPVLNSVIKSLVFNPAWHVPDSIAKKELNKKGRAYFRRNGFITVNGRLVQKPGPKNALGQVKFDFDNPFAVYLHDTSSQSAFGRESRNVSHGCVRVEKPTELAALVLDGVPEGSPEGIQQILSNLDTKRVQLAKPMPVFINYWTAFAGEGGQVEYRKDVYGWDAKLLQLLAAGRQRT